ncbi:hypothetical protein O9X98_09605 [Agrobacterium salinitolerans]|nr:hypothetical protein [Agrobacterium salinitolerans]
MPEQGSIAITARGDKSRWYGRVSIPQSLANEANLTAGMRVSAKCASGYIIIYPDENGRIKFPGMTGKTNPRHAFEAATTTLGLREVLIPQSPTHTFIREGRIHIRVPDECIATETKTRKRAKRDDARTPPPSPKPTLTPVHGIYGATAAVVIEANRAGKKVRPMDDRQIVQLLRELGNEVQQLGPRLYRFQNKTSTISDLLEAANKQTVGQGEGTIILEMNN